MQSFRMVGSKSKDGEQTVRAFRTGGRASIEEMNLYVPAAARIPPAMLGTGCTIEEAGERWPGWDPKWRERKAATPDRPWNIKRDLFDWWCRRVESDETFQGNRYWAIFVAACYAAKCGVSYEELEEWAMRVRPFLDGKTVDPNNHFTEQHVRDALRAYGDPRSVMIRRDKIEEKTSMEMKPNKRNGRPQALHLKLARSHLEILNEEEGRSRQGRPKGSPNKRHPKAEAIRTYAAEHPNASQRQIAKALNVSPTTVNKWLKPDADPIKPAKLPKGIGQALTTEGLDPDELAALLGRNRK